MKNGPLVIAACVAILLTYFFKADLKAETDYFDFRNIGRYRIGCMSSQCAVLDTTTGFIRWEE